MSDPQTYLVVFADGLVAAVDPNSVKWTNYSRASMPDTPTFGLEAALVGDVVLMRSRAGGDVFSCHKDEMLQLARKLVERQPSLLHQPKAA